jgi:hypothetical protein
MGLGINLRFDLKPLTDAQLAELLELSWKRHEEAKGHTGSYKLLYSSRGPIRHSKAYPFFSILRYGTPLGWSLGLALSCSMESLISAQARAVMQMHLALSDIADAMDEIRRRGPRRKII